jgi:porin
VAAQRTTCALLSGDGSPLRSLPRAVTALLVLAAAATVGVADENSPSEGLLGDWDGARTRLYQRGVDLQLAYFAEPAYNITGGTQHLLRNADQITMGATLDLERLWHWPKATFQLTLTDRNGNNLSSDADLRTLMQVQEVFGRGNILRLTEISYEQAFFQDVLDVKVGRLGVGGSFYGWSCQFMNLSFCGQLPGNIVANWYNWPVSQWAARVRVALTQELQFKVGIYQINPSYLENENGTALNPKGTIGALIPVELDWTAKLGSHRLPGTYVIGAWQDTANQPDVFLAADNKPQVLSPGVPPLERGGERGLYVNGQQQITSVGEDVSRGISLFVNYVHADPNTAEISELFSIGLFFQGPLAQRPRDVLGVAAGWTRVNPRVADGQELQNAQPGSAPVAVQNAEYPFEVFYNVNATRWLSLAPVLQYIRRPGGTGANPDVVVVGLNFGVTF